MNKKKINLKATLIIVGLIFAVIQLMIWIPLGYDLFRKKTFVYENFVCKLHIPETGDYISIIGLSEEGKTKKHLYIPSEIKGIPVKELGDYGLMGTEGDGKFESELLEEIYFERMIDVVANDFFTGCPNLSKMICLSNEESLEENSNNCSQYKIINEDIIWLHIYGNTNKNEVTVSNSKLYWPANVIFYNEEEIYYLDFFDKKIDAEIIEPIKEGYKFMGWYKEPECINKYDFEKELLPDIYVTQFSSTYSILKLYAKWGEINND